MAAAALALAGCGSTTSSDTAAEPAAAASSSAATPSAAASSQAPKKSKAVTPETVPGRFVDWDVYDADRAAYADSDVVLHFSASWCPSCRATEESLNTDGVPDGLTVVKVDFDTATDLRQKYGVTVQHTFVQVEPDGTEIKKWTSTLTGAEIAAAAAAA